MRPDRTLAVVGAARYLAITPWSYQHSLNPLNAGLAGPRPALAGTAPERTRRSDTARGSNQIMPS
jgi:hypothetical protein